MDGNCEIHCIILVIKGLSCDYYNRNIKTKTTIIKRIFQSDQTIYETYFLLLLFSLKRVVYFKTNYHFIYFSTSKDESFTVCYSHTTSTYFVLHLGGTWI